MIVHTPGSADKTFCNSVQLLYETSKAYQNRVAVGLREIKGKLELNPLPLGQPSLHNRPILSNFEDKAMVLREKKLDSESVKSSSETFSRGRPETFPVSESFRDSFDWFADFFRFKKSGNGILNLHVVIPLDSRWFDLISTRVTVLGKTVALVNYSATKVNCQIKKQAERPTGRKFHFSLFCFIERTFRNKAVVTSCVRTTYFIAIATYL